DDDDSVSIVVVDTKEQALVIHHEGIKRLIAIAVRQPIKYLEKNLPDLQKICLAYSSIGRCDDLKTSIIDASIEKSFFTSSRPVYTKKEFEKILAQGESGLVKNANAICQVLADIFTLYSSIKKQIKKNSKPNWLVSLADIQSQLDHLVYEDFMYFTPIEYLESYPRYLQAIQYRLEKLPQAAERDRQYTNLLAPYWENFITHDAEYYDHPVFSLYRWMLEEFRVSLFAQNLKTQIPVSEKRIKSQWQEVKKIF
ncbi:MAG: DUF3418 domain-containing protein, partial [Gammaproteobacteria bacterium]|nr:DUF3418 domain-containing protein [Gammaproteobacteria bacterium]